MKLEKTALFYCTILKDGEKPWNWINWISSEAHPSSKFHGNPFSSFCVFLLIINQLTNQPTNKWTWGETMTSD